MGGNRINRGHFADPIHLDHSQPKWAHPALHCQMNSRPQRAPLVSITVKGPSCSTSGYPASQALGTVSKTQLSSKPASGSWPQRPFCAPVPRISCLPAHAKWSNDRAATAGAPLVLCKVQLSSKPASESWPQRPSARRCRAFLGCLPMQSGRSGPPGGCQPPSCTHKTPALHGRPESHQMSELVKLQL